MATFLQYDKLCRDCVSLKPTSKLTSSAEGIALSSPLRENETQVKRRKDKNWDQHRSRELLNGLVKPLFELAYKADAAFPRRPLGPESTTSYANGKRTKLLFELLGFHVSLKKRVSNPVTGCISWLPQRPLPDYATYFQGRRSDLKGDAEREWFDEVIKHLDHDQKRSPLASYFQNPPPQAAAIQAPQANPVSVFDFNDGGALPWARDQVQAPALTQATVPPRPLQPAPQIQVVQANPVGDIGGAGVEKVDSARDFTSFLAQDLPQPGDEFRAPVQEIGVGQEFGGAGGDQVAEPAQDLTLGVDLGDPDGLPPPDDVWWAPMREFGLIPDPVDAGSDQVGEPGMLNAVDVTQHQPAMPLQPVQPYQATQQEFGATQGFMGTGSNQAGQQMWTGFPHLVLPSPETATQQAWSVDTGVARAVMGNGGHQLGHHAMWTGALAHRPLPPQAMVAEPGWSMEIGYNPGFLDVGDEMRQYDAVNYFEPW